MLGGTASLQFSAGHTVDTKGTSPLEAKTKKKKPCSELQCECVRACPALHATEISICAVMSSGIFIPGEQFAWTWRCRGLKAHFCLRALQDCVPPTLLTVRLCHWACLHAQPYFSGNPVCPRPQSEWDYVQSMQKPCSDMWSVQILVGLLRYVHTLITINIPTGVFAAFLWHLLQFAMHAPAYGCCIRACGKFHASTCHFLAILSLPLLSMWGRASVVLKLRCRRAKIYWMTMQKWVFVCQKKKQSNMHGLLCHDLHRQTYTMHCWLSSSVTTRCTRCIQITEAGYFLQRISLEKWADRRL